MRKEVEEKRAIPSNPNLNKDSNLKIENTKEEVVTAAPVAEQKQREISGINLESISPSSARIETIEW